MKTLELVWLPALGQAAPLLRLLLREAEKNMSIRKKERKKKRSGKVTNVHLLRAQQPLSEVEAQGYQQRSKQQELTRLSEQIS